MQRRHFLNASLSSLLVACSTRVTYDGNTTRDTGGLSRFPVLLLEDPELFPQSVASGDAKPHSVVLWTRAPFSDRVFLQVALDAEFSELLALASDQAELRVDTQDRFDHCVKVRLDDLSPSTTYYYRFVVETEGGPRTSHQARTRTAPEVDADVQVSFGVVSCQDYAGRYYHALERLAELLPDFFVHLGDYIYETTDDPSFQSSARERSIVFRDVDGALPTIRPQDPATPVPLAARSLDNYRQLYQEYRSDRSLQKLHEIAPMIVVWDDHEFANDSTGDRAPSQGAAPDPERRRNADQAWFEYMPVDYPAGPDFVFDPTQPFPDNLRIYRDFRFGRHLHLVMTDLRRYRPSHLIAEDTFPGTVLVAEATLLQLYGELPSFAQPYLNVDEYDSGQVGATLRQAAIIGEWGFAPNQLAGDQDIQVLNTWITRYNDEFAPARLTLLTDSQAAGRGIAAIHLGKTDLNSSFGARYLVVQEAYAALSLARYRESDGQSENLLGDAQRAWFIETLTQSNATWKVWGNEYTFLQKAVDLRALPLPDPRLKQRFLVSVEDWDGAPNERRALLTELSAVDNLAIVSGDIHSFFMGSPGVEPLPGDPELLTVTEFVCGAVSSATYDALLAGLVATDSDAAELAPLAEGILEISNPHVAYQNLKANGFAIVRASADALDVAFHQLPATDVFTETLDGELAAHFTVKQFRLVP